MPRHRFEKNWKPADLRKQGKWELSGGQREWQKERARYMKRFRQKLYIQEDSFWILSITEEASYQNPATSVIAGHFLQPAAVS